MGIEEALANIGSFNALTSSVSQGLVGFSLQLKDNLTEKEKSEKERCVRLFENFYRCLREIVEYPNGLPEGNVQKYFKNSYLAQDIGILLAVDKILPDTKERLKWLKKLESVDEAVRRIKAGEQIAPKDINKSKHVLNEFFKVLDERISNQRAKYESLLTGSPSVAYSSYQNYHKLNRG